MAEPFDFGAGPNNNPRDPQPTPIVVHRDQQSFVWSRVQLQSNINNGIYDDGGDGDNDVGGDGEGDNGNDEHINDGNRQVVPPPRSGAASVVVPSLHRMFVFGGYGGGTGRLADFWVYDFQQSKWEEVDVVGDEKPGCRENNGVVISDSSRSFLMFGGYNGTVWLNDLWKFDIEPQPRWTCLQEASHEVDGGGGGGGQNEAGTVTLRPCARFGYVSVAYDGKFILWGGFDGGRWLNDLFVFDLSTSTWSQITQLGSPPSVRSCPAWCHRDGRLFLHGGYDGLERKDDFYVCDLKTYTWQRMPHMGLRPSPRYFHSSVLYGNKLFVYGGYSGNQRLSDLWAYDFETHFWAEVDCSNGDAPSGRSSLVAQVYENYLYVFSGYNGSAVMNDMYRCRLKQIDVPPSSLVSDFQRLINDDEMADVKFLVQGETFHAHRCILAVRSQYFRAMLFNGHMRESAATTSEEGIELTHVSPPVFRKVLEYLYTDTVGDLPWNLGIEVMMAAELFMLDRLKGICEDVIRNEITVDNVVGVLMASHQHNATGLKQIALEVIVQNMSHNKIQIGLQALESEGKLLIEIIKLQSLQPSSPPTRAQPGNGRTIRPLAQPVATARPQAMTHNLYHGRNANPTANPPDNQYARRF